jgi:hypothetical protein
MDTICMDGHGYCDIAEEHGRKWVICPDCGAQWDLLNLEQVSDGDGHCETKDE